MTSPFLPAGPSPRPFCSILEAQRRFTRCFTCGWVCRWDFNCFRYHFWSVQSPPGPFCSMFGSQRRPKKNIRNHPKCVFPAALPAALILGLFSLSLLVGPLSSHITFILPIKYYTFVTSPFPPAGPSPGPFCSITGTHQYAVTLVAQSSGLFLWSLLVDKVSLYLHRHLSVPFLEAQTG